MVTTDINNLANQITTEIDGSSFLSGAPILRIINDVVSRVENYTGQSIGSTAIADKFQPAIVDLAKARVCMDVNMQGGTIGEITIGDFSANRGRGTNMTAAAEYYKQLGDQELKELGRKTSSARVLGV